MAFVIDLGVNASGQASAHVYIKLWSYLRPNGSIDFRQIASDAEDFCRAHLDEPLLGLLEYANERAAALLLSFYLNASDSFSAIDLVQLGDRLQDFMRRNEELLTRTPPATDEIARLLAQENSRLKVTFLFPQDPVPSPGANLFRRVTSNDVKRVANTRKCGLLWIVAIITIAMALCWFLRAHNK